MVKHLAIQALGLASLQACHWNKGNKYSQIISTDNTSAESVYCAVLFQSYIIDEQLNLYDWFLWWCLTCSPYRSYYLQRAILMEKASCGFAWFSQQVERPRPYEERVQLVQQCISDNEEGALALLFVPKGLLLLIGTLAAWPARRLCIPLCNNTRNCALCLVIAAVMCIIEVPIIMHVRQYPNPFYGITGLIIMVVSSALLVIGVVPQVSSDTVFK